METQKQLFVVTDDLAHVPVEKKLLPDNF